MSEQNVPAPRPTNRDLQAMEFAEALDAYTPNLADALPDHIKLSHFKRVVVTAVNLNPDLARADRRTLFNACVKCAHDGLYPDGREAALVVYRTKVKDARGQERWADTVQYMPMIAGIRKRMRNTGEVLSATAEVVYRNDTFRHEKGDKPLLEHVPCALDADRGDPVGAYAIIKLANGEVLREVMGYQEIERVRAFSRNAKTASGKGPWETSWGEMARKTVLRRCHKAAPTGSDLEGLLARDEEYPELPPADEFREIPPRPVREAFQHSDPHVEPPVQPEDTLPPSVELEMGFYGINRDGEEIAIGGTLNDAIDWLEGEMTAARDQAMLDAIWRDHQELIETIQGVSEHLYAHLVAHNADCLSLLDNRDPASPTPERPQDPADPPQQVQAGTPYPQPPGDALPVLQVGQPPLYHGAPEYRSWAQALYLPKARQAVSRKQLIDLWTDNAPRIEAFKQKLPAAYVAWKTELDHVFEALPE